MFGLFRRIPTRRPAPQGRVRLSLESLEWRDQPDGGGLLLDPPPPPGGGGQAVNAAPAIVDFRAQESGNGLFLITGRVVDESPGGLTVTFGGGTSAAGRTTTTLADGTFSIVVQLRLDGTDSGYLTATVTDAQGLVSEPVQVYLDPTIP
jgi:hypothetical protein